MSPNNVTPLEPMPFARIFSSGDIIRVTSLRNRDITWIAEVISCGAHWPIHRASDGVDPRCRIKWISGESDDENFKRYYNSYRYNDPDKHTDTVDTTDSRLHVQLYDKVLNGQGKS